MADGNHPRSLFASGCETRVRKMICVCGERRVCTGVRLYTVATTKLYGDYAVIPVKNIIQVKYGELYGVLYPPICRGCFLLL
jgi:hypothetical protein